MAYRRFQTGTLGRSIKRFGRFPSMGSFKRKSFEWKYVTLDEAALNRSAGTPTTTTIVSASDWAGGGGSGVRNVSFDLRVGVSWSPEVTTVEYDSFALRAGLFIRDDDDATTAILDMFSQQRALWWNATFRNGGEQPTASGVSAETRYINWTVRCKQRFMKFDEVADLSVAFNGATNGIMSDARVSIFGRVSWEAL